MILSMALLRHGRLKTIIMILLRFEALYSIRGNFNNFVHFEFMCEGFITSTIYMCGHQPYSFVVRSFSSHM